MAAIVDPERWAIEPSVDGVRGLVIFEGGQIDTRNRRGELRQWLTSGDCLSGYRSSTTAAC
jgi:hypothetical protein